MNSLEIQRESNSLSRFGRWFQSALIFLILAALLGGIMRYAWVSELPEWIDFRNIRHAHSHVALLGWLHAGVYLFIVFLYRLTNPIYSKLFWLTQGTVLGMLIAFPIQGYSGFSIFFVSVFILLSYYFIYLVFRDIKKIESDYSIYFLKAALIMLFVSSLGTWGLAIIMNTSLKGSAIYYAAIQFYLHFQFNGWLIFGVLALFFKVLSMNKISIDQVKLRWFFWVLVFATVLTYAIAVTWSTPLPFIFWINSIGVILQLISLGFFLSIVRDVASKVKYLFDRDIYILLSIALLSFIIKVLIQTAVVIPYIATISYTIRNFVIGFIHLLMLGCLSLFLIGVYQYFLGKKIKFSRGIKLFVAAIVLSEIILFLQGIMVWFEMGFMAYYYHIIFGASILIPIGLIIYYYRIRNTFKRNLPQTNLQ